MVDPIIPILRKKLVIQHNFEHWVYICLYTVCFLFKGKEILLHLIHLPLTEINNQYLNNILVHFVLEKNKFSSFPQITKDKILEKLLDQHQILRSLFSLNIFNYI